MIEELTSEWKTDNGGKMFLACSLVNADGSVSELAVYPLDEERYFEIAQLRALLEDHAVIFFDGPNARRLNVSGTFV